ncbi:uncharacterized protein LOC120710432 [Panicum virgatum]|uniref:Uncharacterized protein n=1 Tax=Panicum virgatum TaxID=38727 RepID=A0A8T0SAC5_PANVG|nr:uncharacterized protein LOC120710432 [Panicum virgatum]KAG2595187.1 hypothetical protein PVAP13_5KG057000 [Panicum virgatum]
MAAIASVLPVLSQITSSIASTANYGLLNRVLSSLSGSFNDRTSLLLAPAPARSPEQEREPTSPSAADQEARAPGTFDIEAATPASLAEGGGGQGLQDQDTESKRVAKSVHTVCLFAASASLVLFVNLPGNGKDDGVPNASKPGAGAGAAAADGEHGPGGGALYSAGLAFISLGLFSSLGLSMFSIVARPGGAAVAAVQKWGMVVAAASVLVAFTLRMCMVLPTASL